MDTKARHDHNAERFLLKRELRRQPDEIVELRAMDQVVQEAHKVVKHHPSGGRG